MAEHRDIFIVCNTVNELGGLNQWAHDVARLFTARGHRVRLIGVEPAVNVRDFGSELPYETITLHAERLPRRRKVTGVAALSPGFTLRNRKRQQIFEGGVRRLSEILRTAGPGAVVIAAQVWAGEWVAAADTTGMQVIGMSHESFEACRASSRFQRVREFYDGMDIHLSLTDADADAWARAGMSNVGAMPNPLMITPQTLPTLNEKTVVTLGRLSHEKGLDMLIEAWAQVGPRHPDWQLKIYGAGPDEQALRALAREHRLDDTALFQGKTSDIDTALSASSIYVLPSRQEGFPIALMEAMAYGLPTVAFDCAPGIRELIDDEVSGGLVVTPGNVGGFANGLGRLIEDHDLRVRLGSAGRESVQRFTPDSIVDRWESLFALLDR
ncbi:glycosyltransferase [Actinoplanes hulinensis]|uniref:Glycosyltransferase n=1 Tax=Actinoplanes hulinensis TaxID=1144547 RepID=A0ABS7AWM4_9ACTN|nr:glycosyltransferase [Actinoplanes hulinensis]MBW6433142.1 glycosyltransferase [Actinoplanes hulinensis]